MSPSTAEILKVIWTPSPRQKLLISCPVFEVFFGGARGGGKTDGMLGDFANHAQRYGANANALMVRRSLPALLDTIERSKSLYAPLKAQFFEQSKLWRFPNGAKLRFAYLERDADAENYRGHSYTRLYIEELTTFPTPEPVFKLVATLRSGAGVPVGFRATGNPGGPGHQWVRARYIDPAPDGGKIITDPDTGLKRIYIPSRVTDNAYLDDGYVQRLRASASGSEAILRAWIDGCWDVIEGSYFPEWRHDRHILKPFALPKHWLRFRSMDWGSYSPFSVGWWAVVSEEYRLPDGRVLPRGAMIRYREYYGSLDPASSDKGLKLTAEQVGQGIVDREKGDPALAYGRLDPSTFKEDGGPSVASRINGVLIEHKLMPFSPADNTRVDAQRGHMGGWDAMRSRLVGLLDDKGAPKGVPMLYAFDICKTLIRVIPMLQHDPARPEDVLKSPYDHSADETRYACLSRPWVREKPATLSFDVNKDAYRSSRGDGYSDYVQSSVKLL